MVQLKLWRSLILQTAPQFRLYQLKLWLKCVLGNPTRLTGHGDLSGGVPCTTPLHQMVGKYMNKTNNNKKNSQLLKSVSRSCKLCRNPMKNLWQVKERFSYPATWWKDAIRVCSSSQTVWELGFRHGVSSIYSTSLLCDYLINPDDLPTSGGRRFDRTYRPPGSASTDLCRSRCTAGLYLRPVLRGYRQTYRGRSQRYGIVCRWHKRQQALCKRATERSEALSES